MKAIVDRGVIFCGVVLLAACGSEVVEPIGAGGSGGGAGAADPGPTPAQCDAIASRIAQVASDSAAQHAPEGGPKACTATVRVDAQSLLIVGHNLFCGSATRVDEAAARAAAHAAWDGSGFHNTGDGDVLSGAAADDEWIFQYVFGDFGHWEAVSVRGGLALVTGSLDWNGNNNEPLNGYRGGGVVAAPVGSEWLSDDWGAGCSTSALPPIRFFDIRTAGGMLATTAEQAEAAVMSTALSAGLADLTIVDGVVVLSPSGPEYVVMLNAVSPP